MTSRARTTARGRRVENMTPPYEDSGFYSDAPDLVGQVGRSLDPPDPPDLLNPLDPPDPLDLLDPPDPPDLLDLLDPPDPVLARTVQYARPEERMKLIGIAL